MDQPQAQPPMPRRTLLVGLATAGVAGAAVAAGPQASQAVAAGNGRGKPGKPTPTPTPPAPPYSVRTFTDPFASLASTASGRMIKSLAVDASGNVFPGHGDWGANIGPIDVHYLDPRTGSFSDSLLRMPTESTENLRAIEGRIFIPNTDPKTYWEGGQPFAYENSDGTFAMSGWSHTEHAYDICRLPSSWGTDAFAIIGHYVFGNNTADYAVYFTVDGGATFTAAVIPSTKNYSSSSTQGIFVLGNQLYTTAKGQLWLWSGTLPTTDQEPWANHFSVATTKFQSSNFYDSGQSAASNGSVALLNGAIDFVPGIIATNGRSVWQARPGEGFGPLTAGPGGYLYTITPAGLLRTKDGRAWERHAGVTYPSTALPSFLSLAVDEAAVWGGTADSQIWDFASATGPWVSA